jgi:hypothetical protein
LFAVTEARIPSWLGPVALVVALLAAVAGPLACSAGSEARDQLESAALATYRVVLEGRNYLLRVGDEERRVGFSATRIVQAPSSDVAAEMAIELVERDGIWAGKIVNEASDRPRLQATQVEEIEPGEVGTEPGLDYDFHDDFHDDFYDRDEDSGDYL